MPCVLHPILGLLAPITCLVATMSFLHICHVPSIATCLPWLPHTWWTVALSIVLSATLYSLHPMHIMLGLSCTWPMCLDTSFYLVLWMLPMPTIDLSLRSCECLLWTWGRCFFSCHTYLHHYLTFTCLSPWFLCLCSIYMLTFHATILCHTLCYTWWPHLFGESPLECLVLH